jgi:PAS domain S-box-containing protein
MPAVKDTTQAKRSRLNTILSWMTTTPSQSQSRHLITFQLILAWSVIIAIGYAIAYQLLLQQAPTIPLWRLVLLIIFYILSRTQYHIIALFGLVISMLAHPYMTLITPESQHELTMMACLTVLTIPLVGILIPKRNVLYVMTLAVIFNLLGLWFFTQQIDPLIILILIVVSASIMVWFIVRPEVFQGQDISNSIHEKLIVMSPDIMAIVEKNHFTYINPAGLRLLGATDREIIGKPLHSVIPFVNTDTPTSDKYTIGTSHLGDMTIQSVETIQPIVGDPYRALVTFTPFEQSGTMATLLTVTALPTSISQSEQILESSMAMTAIHQNNKIVYINSQFERLTGYSREEIYSSDYRTFNLAHSDDIDRVSSWISEMEQGISRSDVLEYRIHRKDGSIIWLKCSGSTIRYAGKPALLTTSIDVTDYHSEPSLRLIQDAMPYPWVMVKNQDEIPTIVDYHTATAEWLEDDPSLIGKPVSQLISDLPESLALLLKRTPPTDNLSTQRNVSKHAHINKTPIEWTATPLKDHDHADYLITLRPIDYETQLEKDLLRYRTMFDMMNDYAFILRLSSDGRFDLEWASDSFEKITGYNPYDESLSAFTEKTTYPPDKLIRRKYINQLLRGEMSIVEHRIITKSGQIRWLRKYAYPQVENGQTSVVYGSVSDITDLVNAEEAIRYSAMQQSVIAEIGMVAVKGELGSEEFVDQVLNFLNQLMNVPWSVAIEYHASTQKFMIHSVVGEPEIAKVESDPDDRNTFLGYVLHQNDPVVVPDWSKETRFQPLQILRDLGVQTSLSVVVPMQDKPFGVLNVHDTNLRQFTGEQINLLQTIANIIGTHIQQRQTQEAVREQRILADALIRIAAVLNSESELIDILKLILNTLSQVIPAAESCNVMLVDKDRNTANIAYYYTINSDLPYIQIGHEVSLDDIPNVANMIATGEPIISDNVTRVLCFGLFGVI